MRATLRFHTHALVLILSISIATSMAVAEKMDLNTHTVVIDRLRQIIQSLDNSDVSKVPSTLRLADLLAERSRIKALSEVEQSCTNCLKSKEDRVEATSHYDNIIPRLSEDMRGHAFLQKAHLHLSLNQIEKAEKIHLQITKEGKKRHKGETLGQSHASLGDIYFQKSQFKQAKSEYEKALSIEESPQKGLVHYRLAWCLFNMEQVPSAIAKLEMILKNPKLTEYKNAEGITQDESFKIDVSKDLSSFYARQTINQDTLNKVLQLSPASYRMQNIHALATEADRLGKKKEAALVWMFYLSNSDQKKDALEAQIRIMKLKRDTGNLPGAIQLFAQVKETWKDQGCGDNCDKLQSEVRRWIIDWNREEKKIQSTELTHAYVIYTDLFPKDDEMLLLGAAAAQQRKQYKSAYEFFQKAANVSAANKNQKTLENALVGEMDMAETLKNPELRMQSYNHYLKLNEKGARTFEVRYQIAKLHFELKVFDKSASHFKALATEGNAKEHRKEKVEAAHLALNSLIQLKDDEAIENWSLEFATRFQEDKKEFYKIHRKSVLNTVAQKINAKKSGNSDLVKLKSVSMVDSSDVEKKNLYKNMYLLSLQLKNFKDALHANLNTLALKTLTEREHSQAIQDRIWLAEMELDHKQAYELTKKSAGAMSSDEALKLIWLAEMANLKPDQHEEDFLKLSQNKKARASIIVRRIQRQMLPQKMLKQHIAELSQSPDVLAKLALEIYSKNHNKQILEDVFNYPSVRKSAFAGLLSRLISYPSIQKDIAHISSLRLNTKNQNTLKKSLEERIKNLSHFETFLKESVKSRDISMQAIFLNVLKYEYARLHTNLVGLPLPRGLTKEQREQYTQILGQQAQPYLEKSKKIEEKLQALWSGEGWLTVHANTYKNARLEYRHALKEDLQQLIRHAPPSKARYLEQTLNERASYPSSQVVSQAQNQIRKNPFEEANVAKLKEIESLRGNDVTVAYLEARMAQMKVMFQ